MSLLSHARYALRMVRNAPVQFLVIIITLAVGIGANSAMFSIVDAVLLRPLPYPDPEQVVTVTLRDAEGIPNIPVSYPDYEDWTRQSKNFSSITATRAVNFSLLQGDTPERVRGLRVSPNLMETLGLNPELGRSFRPEEAISGNEYVAMITHELWQSHFADSNDVVGKSILLGRVPYVVIGVLPPMALPHAAQGPNSPQIVVPFAAQANEKNRGLLFLRVIGRIKTGVPMQSALAEMQVVNASVEAANPSSHQKATVEMMPVREWIVGRVRPMVVTLFGAVALVLLIACANVASILLGRSSLRAGELAVRSALGASRRELISQLLIEAAVLSLLGALFGLALGWGFIWMARHYAGSMLPRAGDIGMNLHVLVVTLCGALASSLLFGILPALKASRTQPVEAMKRQGRSSGIASRSALRALLVTEIAITLVLMVGSALAVRSFIHLSSVPSGFDPDHVVAAEIELPASDYKTVEQCADFFHNAVDRLRTLPGVESVAAAGRLPLLGFNQGSSYQVEGQNLSPKDWVSADVRIITPGYFRTIGIPLIAGRDYTETDTANSPLVAVVNAEFARRYWPNQGAVGHKLQMFPQTTVWREIIGVVGDVKLQSLDSPVGPAIYIVARQNPFLNAARGLFVVLKVKGSPDSIYPALRQEIRFIDASQSVSGLVNMNETVSNSLSRNRLTMVLLLTFGGIALILAAVGVYGVVGLFVTSRMQEIGIRMALGASPGRVLRLILGETTIFAAIAIAIGGATAFFAARSMRQLLFEISTADPLTFAITIGTILITTLLAAAIPTRRAMHADPLVVLRVE
jgi:putative ABC transport system permease protein